MGCFRNSVGTLRRLKGVRSRNRQICPYARTEMPLKCYHDVMTKKTTTIRMPEELADTVEIVARGRGMSVNGFVIDALNHEVELARRDGDFMARLKEMTLRDREILDRLAE